MSHMPIETPEAMAERYHWSDPSIEQMASEISARDKAVALRVLREAHDRLCAEDVSVLPEIIIGEMIEDYTKHEADQ